MPRARRALPALATSLLLLALTSGCGLLNGSNDEQTQQVYGNPENLEKPTIRVAALPTLDAAPLHIALQKGGEFAKEGLNVELVTITQGGQGVEKLASGGSEGVDITFGSYTPFILAEAKGILAGRGGLKLVADATALDRGNSMIVVGKDSGINDIRDLRGKKVAVVGIGTMTWLLTAASLQDNDVDPQSVTFVEVPFPVTAAAIDNNQVDAAFLTEPFLAEAQMKFGIKALYDTDNGLTGGMPLTGYATTADFAEQNPNTIAAFQRAMTRATVHAGNNRGDVQDLLPKYAKVSPSTAAVMRFTSFKTGLVPAQIKRVVRLMVSSQMLPPTGPDGKPLDAEKMVEGMIIKPAPVETR